MTTTMALLDEPDEDNGRSRRPRETPVEFVPLREFSTFVTDYRRFARVVVTLLALQILLSGAGVLMAIWK